MAECSSSVSLQALPGDFDHEGDSPYMLVVADVKKELQRDLSEKDRNAMKDPDLRKRVNVPRSTLPAITHVDMSARMQTIDEKRHGRFYRLMKEFKKQTGCFCCAFHRGKH